MESAADKWKMELQKSIVLLNQTLDKLGAIFADPEQQAEIDEKILEINSEIDTLQEILNNVEASEVVVPGVTPEAAEAFNAAMKELDKEIERDQQFNKIMKAATAILNAASEVVSEAKKI